MNFKYMHKANKKREAELGVEKILAKLAAKSYRNAEHEEAERKMLERYLNDH